MLEPSEKRICDKCNNFEVTPCGMSEICHAQKDGSRVIPDMPTDYVNERMYGDKMTCKRFHKIIVHF